GDDVGEVLRRVQCGNFPPPRQVKKNVPAALEAVCLKAMALRPQDRYASAKALADDVEHWLADEPTTAYREPPAQRLARRTRRHRRAVAVGSVALVLTAAAALGGLWLWAEAEQRREQQLFSAEQQRLAEQREYLSGLRAAAEADERLAVAELRAGRL